MASKRSSGNSQAETAKAKQGEVSYVWPTHRKGHHVKAITVSDIHLSHRPPPARAREPSWYGAMERALKELKAAAKEYKAPIVCAGDIFHVWDSPAELISFALDNLPPMYALPGQHDLPYHELEDIHRSAYWTLVVAGRIQNLTYKHTPLIVSDGLTLHAFPWGVPLDKNWSVKFTPKSLDLLVAHHYVWFRKSTSFKGAQFDDCLKNPALRKTLSGYDVATFGDNHKGFIAKIGNCEVINNGTFMRRRRDEVNNQPMIGLVWSDGKVTPHYLDTSQDVFDVEVDEPDVTGQFGFDVVISELGSLSEKILDFREAVKRGLVLADTMTKGAKRLVRRSLPSES